jgi:NADPH:quinone reductase-like Zn-dependent oxidoreductase
MFSLSIPKPGPSSVIELIEKKLTPTLKDNEVHVEVKYSGINFADIMARKGTYQDAPPFPCVVGYEVSGIVKNIGSKKLEHLLEREVLCFTHFGGYSSDIILPAHSVFIKPQNLSLEQAAALPVNYLTAYLLLIGMGSLKAHETILIHNAGGGVGLAAVELAKYIGAKIMGTASKSKHQKLLEFGVDHVLDYRTNSWIDEYKKITNNQGVELIIDPIGGSSWKNSYQLLRSTGRLGMFGVSSGSESKFSQLKMLLQMPIFHPISLLNNNRSVFGVNMGRLWHEPEKATLWMKDILDLVQKNIIKPHVDKIFPYQEISQAHDYIENRKNFGKVLLKMFD